MMNVTKMLYHEPRPYFITDEIENHSCAIEYGNPSGHSVQMACFSFYLFLEYINENPSTTLQKVAGLSMVCIATLLMGLARMLLGLHTFNQILFGISLGLWLGSFFYFQFGKSLNLHIQNIMEGGALSI